MRLNQIDILKDLQNKDSHAKSSQQLRISDKSKKHKSCVFFLMKFISRTLKIILALCTLHC